MKLIQRIEYINRLLSVVGTPDIKVITGIRRSGKSKLMDMFMERLKKENRKANVIHVNFNDPKSEPLAEYHALYDFVQKNTNKMFQISFSLTKFRCAKVLKKQLMACMQQKNLTYT